ncbi:class-II fumarase/aspartase family protein [Aestuariivita boseongensis]|uniref:class-II fumarase/aspartase family protein n=1 Tax=Aestuariivita boseongensis TaxID=1470562 RepID=UPI0006801101|nr:adenylosuccinate lyase family protein [Aestuariivita boseongensis]
MAASVFDSLIYTRLFPTGETARLFSDTAEVRAMLLVEGALAKVQGAQGIIPEISAQAIHRATMELQIDPAALAAPTGENGVSVPGLLAAFRSAMNAPEHAQYLHWGATSQDIIDTGLMLRLRQTLGQFETHLREVLAKMGTLADTHADLPMAARTYGQHATPTSFGALVAGWGWPLLDLLHELDALRASSLWVSLSGAAGTSSALGPDAAQTRADLAAALGLNDPGRSWHTDRGPILRIANWMGRVSIALAKMGEDLTALTQTGIGEIGLGATGASSTMPQKQNPVAPSALTALCAQVQGQQGVLLNAASHRYQRDGAAWFAEWTALPQIVLGTAAALNIARTLAPTIVPNAGVMADTLASQLDMIHAEALSFALAKKLPHPDAQAATKALCREAQESQTPLSKLVARDHPDLDAQTLFDPAQQMGLAPQDAHRFAAAVVAIKS